MKNATVTMPFDDFMAIKNKADRLEKEVNNQGQKMTEKDVFLDELIACIENMADAKEESHRQFHLAKSLQAICNYFDMNMFEEYGEIDMGVEPPEVK